jgi:hypothetical protein
MDTHFRARFLSHAWTPRHHARALMATAALAGTLLAGAPGSATATEAAPAGQAAIEARYQAERQACLDGRTGQDRHTCLKEAGAARAESLRQRLDNGETRATLEANALRRCAAQPPAERADCELLARGRGMEQGSVREGGVIKEVVTRSVGRAPKADSARPGGAPGQAPALPTR